MFSKSAKESLLSPSRSASSMALSQTSVTSSGVSSPLVSLFRVFSMSSLQMKLSLLKSGPEPEHHLLRKLSQYRDREEQNQRTRRTCYHRSWRRRWSWALWVKSHREQKTCRQSRWSSGSLVRPLRMSPRFCLWTGSPVETNVQNNSLS